MFMKDLIPNLVSSIDLWVQSGSDQIAAETRAQVREASKEVELTLQRVSAMLFHASACLFMLTIDRNY